MKQDDFYDFASLFKNILVNRKKDTDGNISSWNEVRWLRYSKKFGEVMYKNSLSEEEPFKKISFLRKFEPGIVHVIHGVPKTFTLLLGNSREEKKDLESILHLLSPENKKFYLDLPIDEKLNNTDPDIPAHDDEISEEINGIIALSVKKGLEKARASKRCKTLIKRNDGRMNKGNSPMAKETAKDAKKSGKRETSSNRNDAKSDRNNSSTAKKGAKKTKTPAKSPTLMRPDNEEMNEENSPTAKKNTRRSKKSGKYEISSSCHYGEMHGNIPLAAQKGLEKSRISKKCKSLVKLNSTLELHEQR
ncbi:hypothetical protein QAD02_008178 [Eretmocerus hayati]|uniref:Uncharacterized protein n=1 Tax=Eretmocerus hayati TaxID=131215 RepID=A0ACC2N617_9HYME|nr:hypothetical protein QAD02_008178 [Eretmocerus hayati]